MATDQSTLQKFIQQAGGTHTTGQLNVPSKAGTGNPNTVYNWSSYGVTPGANGAAPTFNLQQQNVPASNPGYEPPFAADPYLAGVLSGMPQAQGNEHVDRILGRLFSGGSGWNSPGTGVPAGPPGPGTPVPKPPGSPSPGIPGYTPPGGVSGPDQIGPISGPIANNPHNWQDNFENAQPNTGPNDPGAPGRTQALDWLRMGFEGGNTNRAWNGIIGRDLPAPNTTEGEGFWSNLWNSLRTTASNAISEGLGNLSDWRQLLDILSEPFVPGDWYNSETGEWNNPLEASGITDLFSSARDSLSDEQQQALLNQSLNTAQGNMNSQREAIINRYMQQFSGYLTPEESRRRAEEIYNSAPEMTEQEWRRVQESFDWNNFWNSSGQGTTRNPVTGLPSMDLIDDMINQMAARAVNWTNEQIARRGHRER